MKKKGNNNSLYTSQEQKKLIRNNYQLLLDKYEELFLQSRGLKESIDRENIEQITLLLNERDEIISQIKKIEKNLNHYITDFGYSLTELKLSEEKLRQVMEDILEFDQKNQHNLLILKGKMQKKFNQQKNKLKINKEYSKTIKMNK